jgi:hypothetical protein
MFATRRFTSIVALALAAIVLPSCADDVAPTGPVAPVAITPDASLLGGLVGTVEGVVGTVTDVVGNVLNLGFTECPTERTQSGSAWIGSAGGTVKVGPHRLEVPRGALNKTVRISGVAPEGDYAQITFEPEGLKFKRPTTLVMSYDGCRIEELPQLRIVFVNDSFEIIEVLPTTTNSRDETATSNLDHFSRYMLAD